MTPTAPSTAPLMSPRCPRPAVFCSAGQLRTSCAGIALEAGCATWLGARPSAGLTGAVAFAGYGVLWGLGDAG